MSGSVSNTNNPGKNVFMAMDVDDIDDEMPFELLAHVREAMIETLPEQSRHKYNRVYKNFKDWQSQHATPSVSNQLVLAYFHMLSRTKNYKPTSLWAYHSMLKATMRTYEDIDIGKYAQVTAFLKLKSSGYRSIKAKVFSEENIKTFIDNADMLTWLDVKVVCIFGICGALRTDEFTRINLEDVEKHGSLFLVKIDQTKTKIQCSFTINVVFAGIVQKFIDLRPADLKRSDRFFTNYQRGKCRKQFIGKNKFSNMPRRIAEYLSLPEPERHTGHSFRRTSATFLANSGADIETIMRHGGWRNESCAKVYIEESLGYKTRTGDMIQRAILGTVVPSANACMVVPPTYSSIGAMLGTVGPSSTVGMAISPTGAVTSAIDLETCRNPSTITTSNASANTAVTVPLFNDVADSFFDSIIPDEQLVEIVDRASQSLQQSTEILVGNDVGESGDSFRDIDEGVSASSTVLTQSTNSSLKAILSRTFKSVNFERMQNCHFNFYFKK